MTTSPPPSSAWARSMTSWHWGLWTTTSTFRSVRCSTAPLEQKLTSPSQRSCCFLIIAFESQLARWLKSNQHVYMLRHQEIQYNQLLFRQQNQPFNKQSRRLLKWWRRIPSNYFILVLMSALLACHWVIELAYISIAYISFLFISFFISVVFYHFLLIQNIYFQLCSRKREREKRNKGKR